MKTYKVHDWHYRRGKSFPPDSLVTIPADEEPHPEWELVEGKEAPKAPKRETKAQKAKREKMDAEEKDEGDDGGEDEATEPRIADQSI